MCWWGGEAVDVSGATFSRIVRLTRLSRAGDGGGCILRPGASYPRLPRVNCGENEFAVISVQMPAFL